MRIAVIGVGLIGGSIGLAAKENLPGVTVSGYDPQAGVASKAVEIGAIDEAAGSVAAAAKDAEACFVACPVRDLPDVVAQTLAAAPAECVVTDVGSTKKLVVDSVPAESAARFVGGHPLAGAETSGVENARADLFQGATWYLTPTRESSGVLYERLHRVLAGIGARCVAIDAEAHDRLMATVSHLPHVLANVLVAQAAQTLAEEDERLPATGPSFRDVTRVAGSNPALWSDIFLANREAIAAEVDEHVRRLEDVSAALKSGDRGAVDSWIAEARANRQRLLEPQLDGGPVSEIRAIVPNRPGIVAEVALALGKAGVNIVDIALHPAPDWRSGAVTLWIAGAADADRALKIVADLGYSVSRIESGGPQDEG